MRHYQYTPNIISKNQNNVWLREVRSLITPIFGFCFLFTFFSPNSQPSLLFFLHQLAFFFFYFIFFPQLPTLFPPGKGPFASLARGYIFHHFCLRPSSPPTVLGGSILFTYIKLLGVCLKTEELRWGSPTATPPFEPFVQRIVCVSFP